MKSIRIICVDDDPLALDQLKNVLIALDMPLDCSFFGSAKQALEAHRNNRADIVISDLRMGATTGIEVISEMQKFAPETFYMLLSGDADLQSALTAMNEIRVFRFFTKPATVGEIGAGLAEAICEKNLRTMRLIANSALDAIERMNTAVASISVDGKIIYANEPADAILQYSGAFLISSDGAFRAVNAGEQKNFMEWLNTLHSTENIGAPVNVFRFSRADDEGPIIVSVVYSEATDHSEAHFSCIFSDTTRTDIATVSGIATALNLTQSEARIVHGLVVGGSVDEAAAMAGVSVSTARTYLKNVFHKTGVSRQAELVRLAILTAA